MNTDGDKRSLAELEESTREQIRFLRASCQAYDDGFRGEAKRIASAAYILLHDGGQQKSLLRRVGLRDKIQFLSASDPSCGLECYVPYIVRSVPEQGGHFIPDFKIIREARERLMRVRYTDWIDGKMFVNANGKQLSRKNLLFSLRNQDGGGHVDDKLRDEAYRWLTLKGSDNSKVPLKGGFAFRIDPSDIVNGVAYLDLRKTYGEPVKDGHLAIMRVIGWEISESLSDAGW